MRRFVFAALIGGFIGFAVLLHVAAEKAGCWGYQNIAFPNVVLLPVTEHRICDLMTSARVLLFRKELVECGFEFFVRGAGSGVLFLLLVDGLFKRIRNCPPSNPGYSLIEWMFQPRQEVFITYEELLISCFCLLPVFAFLNVWARLDLFLFEGCLDATSIAILLPSLLLLCMIILASHRKHLHLWQVLRISATRPFLHGLSRFTSLSFQLTVFVMSVFLSCGFIEVCSKEYGGITRLSSRLVNPPSDHLYKIIVNEEAFNVVDSALYTSFVILIIQIIAYKLATRKSWQAITLVSTVHAFLVCWALLYILPELHFLVLNRSVDGVFNRMIVRDVYRVCVALSTIPVSLAGIAIMMAPSQNPQDTRTETAKLACLSADAHRALDTVLAKR